MKQTKTVKLRLRFPRNEISADALFIKEYRVQHQLFQRDLVKKFSKYGVKLNTLRSWENDSRRPPQWFLNLLKESEK